MSRLTALTMMALTEPKDRLVGLHTYWMVGLIYISWITKPVIKGVTRL
jgi:hypothetical protein